MLQVLITYAHIHTNKCTFTAAETFSPDEAPTKNPSS